MRGLEKRQLKNELCVTIWNPRLTVETEADHGGAAAWAGWAMAHPKFWLGGPQCIWPHQ